VTSDAFRSKPLSAKWRRTRRLRRARGNVA
jgi:hypothetical protein